MDSSSEIKTFAACAAGGLVLLGILCGIASLIPIDSAEIWGTEDSTNVQWRIEYTDSSVDHIVCVIMPDGLTGTICVETMNSYRDFEWKTIEMSNVTTVYGLNKIHEWDVLWHN